MKSFNRPLILASSSPRRQYLMKEVGFQFKVESPDIDEAFPAGMDVQRVPTFLAETKAKVFAEKINTEIVITADTIVILKDKILNKPRDRAEAIAMLTELSGQTHLVITAVCLFSKKKIDCFDDHTKVTFNKLSNAEISFYVDTCKPFDKAGAYGVQECLPAGMNPCSQEEVDFLKRIAKLDLIEKSLVTVKTGRGMDGIEKINGSYFNVMGMPIHKVYSHLLNF
ncbi:MAG: Maf family protein [Bacteroidota bacterium]